ncbi:MAG: TldD/PmbA family protein [Acidimicrobiales bacterium]
MDAEELLAVVDGIVDRALPGEQVEAVAVDETATEVVAYDGDVESYTSSASAGVGVRVIVDHRQGFAYAGSLDADAVAEALAEARDNARFATVDEHVALAEPDGHPFAEIESWDPSVSAFPNERKIELALELERAVKAADTRIVGVESAEYADGESVAAIATTSGIRTASHESSSYVVASSLAADGEEMQTGFGFAVGRDPAALDIAKAATDAADRATRLLGATKPTSGRTTIVFDPFVTAQFLAIVGSTLSGESVLKGRSLFADRLGDEVAAACVTLVDDPTNPDAFTATRADGEGLATRRNVLFDGGVLQRFVHNSYTARRTGTASTGNAVRGFSSTPAVGCMALSLVPGMRKQAELVSDVSDGVLVQGVSGLHSGVNPVSGDFSTGAEGLRISSGSLGEPLREFTIASTLQRMLLDVIEVGGDVDWLPMSAAGVSLVVDGVTVSGA